MAVFAQHLAFKVATLQYITSNRVVEFDGAERCDMSVTALVFSVALPAFFFFFHQAVVAPLQGDILQDFSVTIFTKLGLGVLVERLVAILAIYFVFAMPLNHFSGHG